MTIEPEAKVFGAVSAEIARIRRKSIIQGYGLLLFELCVGALVLARTSPNLSLGIRIKECKIFGYALSFLPPFYIIICVGGVLTVSFIFVIFMFSFENQANLVKYGGSVRPVRLVFAFIFTSLAFIILMFAALYRWIGIYGDNNTTCTRAGCTSITELTHGIGDCIYFSIITLTTVGYGDYHPIHSALSHAVAGFEAISGYVILGVLVSSLSIMLRSK